MTAATARAGAAQLMRANDHTTVGRPTLMSPSPLRPTCTPAEHDQFVRTALATYTPRALDAAAWQAATDEVVAAVAATRPGTMRTARTLASVACRALASQHQWDRRTRPDLAGMLTSDEVTRLCERWRSHGASLGMCLQLRRLAQALNPTTNPTDRPRRERPSSLGKRTLPDLATRPVPTTAALAGYTAAGGRVHSLTFRGLDLPGLAPDLACLLTPTGTDSECPASTFAAARPAARALAAVRTAEAKEVSPISSSPSAKPTNTSKPPARRRRRRTPATTDSGPAVAPLSDDIAAAIAAYRPYRLPQPAWERIQNATRAALTAYRPHSASPGVTSAARPIVAFAWWVANHPTRPDPAASLDVSELVGDGLIDRYILSLAGKAPDATRATHRSVLRRAVRNLGMTPQMPRLSYQAVQPPYSNGEVAQMVLAYNQPTVTRRRVFLTMLALGLGAGLDAGDQSRVAPGHIHDHTDADGVTVTLVTVTSRRPRTVVVADEYLPLLRDAVALHKAAGRKDSTPLVGNRATRRVPTDMMVTAAGRATPVSVSRLRSTWLVAAMSAPVPLSVVLRVSGLASARTLADLLPHCPQPDPDQVAGLLSGLRTGPGRTGEQS